MCVREREMSVHQMSIKEIGLQFVSALFCHHYIRFVRFRYTRCIMVRSQLAVRRHWNVSDRCRMVVTTTTMMMQETRFDAMHRRQDDVRSPDDESCRQILHLGEWPSSCEHDTRRDTLVNHRFYRIVFVILILISPSNALPLYPARVPYIQQYPSQPVQFSYSPYAASVQQAPAMLAYPSRCPTTARTASPCYGRTHGRPLRRRRFVRPRAPLSSSLSLDLGDGQLTKDELYSMALRSNIFPKFHHYLRQTPL